MYSGSIYFLGKYRPLNVEAQTVEELGDRLLLAIFDLPEDQWQKLRDWIVQLRERMIEKPNYSSATAEHGTLGVSIKQGKHDPWLDDITSKLPACPRLNYSA